MRRGLMSLTLPGQRKRKHQNMELAEKKANEAGKPVTTPNEPQHEPLKMEPNYIQRIYIPKTPSLLKTVTKKHNEMAARARQKKD